MSETTYAPRPTIGATRAWEFPRPVRFTLDNGARVQHFPMPGQQLASVEILLPANLHDEPAGLEGVGGIAIEAVLEGPRGWERGAFARAIAAQAAEVETVMTSEGTHLSISAPTSRLARTLGLVTRALSEPRLHRLDTERLITARLDFLAIAEIDPVLKAQLALARAYFPGDHRERLPEFGTTESLSAMRPADVERFVRERLSPRDALIAIAGDLDTQAAQEVLDLTLGTWRAVGGSERRGRPLESTGTGLVLVEMPDTAQTRLVFASPCLQRTDPRWADATVAVHALGGSMSSLLNMRLREEKGLTYGVTSDLRPTRHGGRLQLETSVDAEVTAEAVHDILDVLGTLHREGLSAQDHARSVEELTAGGALGFERAQDVASAAIDIAVGGLPDSWPSLLRERIRATTVDSVRAAVPTLGLDGGVLVAAGDVSLLVDALSAVGLGPARSADGVGEVPMSPPRPSDPRTTDPMTTDPTSPETR